MLGIGYVLAFNEPPLTLTGTFAILVINCAAHYLAVAVEAGLGKLAQIDPSLEEASADLGVGRTGTFVRVVLPLMGTAFLVALTYAFVNSMLTLSAIVFLISPGSRAGRVGHLRVRAHGRAGARLRPVAPAHRRGPRRPGPPVDGRPAERPVRARDGPMSPQAEGRRINSRRRASPMRHPVSTLARSAASRAAR